ncbi:MAG: hypothetical protein KAW67_05755, partial [Candidatus Eisenbacteria sp.]|nr:hypothetical protein [Candidatus Eisenbacteria bacterium]
MLWIEAADTGSRRIGAGDARTAGRMAAAGSGPIQRPARTTEERMGFVYADIKAIGERIERESGF